MKGVHGYLVGIYALCHITKVQLFKCNKDSELNSLHCDPGTCCTPVDKLVKAAEVTDTNGLCFLGAFYHIFEEFPNKRCVRVSFLCKVTFSYCYLKDTSSSVSSTSCTTTVARSSSTTPLENVSISTIPSENASTPIQKAVTSGVHESTDSYSSSFVSETNEITVHAVSSGMIRTSGKNDEDKNQFGVIAGVSVAALALVIICTCFATLLVIRIRRKRTQRSATIDTSNRVITLSNRVYTEDGECENSHDGIATINLSSSALSGVSTDTTYAAVNKGNITKLTEQKYTSAFRNSSNDYNVQCADSNEESAYDTTDQQANHAVIEDAYDHTFSTDKGNTYNRKFQEIKSFNPIYDHTTRFQFRNTLDTNCPGHTESRDETYETSS